MLGRRRLCGGGTASRERGHHGSGDGLLLNRIDLDLERAIVDEGLVGVVLLVLFFALFSFCVLVFE